MTIHDAIGILQGGILVTFKIAAPMLIVAMCVGLIVAVIQTTTSIQEQTLTFVPKLLAIVITMVIFASWFVQTLVDYTKEIFELIAKI
jgi:flagellar biosynthetic protein FliQ